MFKEFLQQDGLTLTRLHTLVQLAEAGSLTVATGGDTGRQSRMSHHLKELRDFFGAPLTERSGKSVRLNAKGMELAALARQQFGAMQNFRRSLQTGGHEWKIGAGDSLLQWLLIPAVGRGSPDRHYRIHNLRTAEVAAQVQDERLDFGLIRKNAVPASLAAADICFLTYVIVIPRRLQQRNRTVQSALTDLPHAAIAGEGQLTEQLRTIAGGLGGNYRARILCDSLGQCLAAVKTGGFAAVLPAHVVSEATAGEIEVIETDLDELNRPISLIWNRRTMEMLGRVAVRMKDELLGHLREEAVDRGIRKDTLRQR